jgi:hypothetical protein
MDHTDIALKKYLKGWADRQPLPAGGRSKLISTAAYLRGKKGKDLSVNFPEMPSELLSWAMVYCLDQRFNMARLVS